MGFESVTCDEALVIFGSCLSVPKKVVGPRTQWLWPGQYCQRLFLKTFTINIQSRDINTSQKIPISCVGIAQVKVEANNQQMFQSACTLFLDKPESEIITSAMEKIEAHQNSVINSMTLEEIYFNRKKFCTRVFEISTSDLEIIEIAMVSYTLKTVTENQGHLAEIGRKRAAEAKAAGM